MDILLKLRPVEYHICIMLPADDEVLHSNKMCGVLVACDDMSEFIHIPDGEGRYFTLLFA
jgi:hypothetical protein